MKIEKSNIKPIIPAHVVTKIYKAVLSEDRIYQEKKRKENELIVYEKQKDGSYLA